MKHVISALTTSADAPASYDMAPARAVDAYLADLLPTMGLAPNLEGAVRYSLLIGGKRLRPTLTILSCQCCGGQLEDALPAAAAIEMIHAFSLIHDDLPSMDDDDLRRGQPTCHVKYGEALAILAGDALATLPYLVIGRGPNPPAVQHQLILELAEATKQMILGQVYDTVGGYPADWKPLRQLEQTHRHKTGALLRASCRLGAMSAEADETQLASLTTFGETVGLLFQVIDDILDVTQSSEQLGKRTGKDESAGKLTYPSILGLEESQRKAANLCRQAIDALAPLARKPSQVQPLINLCQYMAVREK